MDREGKVGDLVEGFERGGSGVRESKMPALLYANIQSESGRRFGACEVDRVRRSQ